MPSVPRSARDAAGASAVDWLDRLRLELRFGSHALVKPAGGPLVCRSCRNRTGQCLRDRALPIKMPAGSRRRAFAFAVRCQATLQPSDTQCGDLCIRERGRVNPVSRPNWMLSHPPSHLPELRELSTTSASSRTAYNGWVDAPARTVPALLSPIAAARAGVDGAPIAQPIVQQLPCAIAGRREVCRRRLVGERRVTVRAGDGRGDRRLEHATGDA